MENQIKLRWTSHTGTVMSMLDTLLSLESMVDVTLACDGQYVRAHKVVLSACSPYFQDLFAIEGSGNPILYLRGVKLPELNALLRYMYRGEVSVAHEELPSILEIAKELKIRGLADVCGNMAAPDIIDTTLKSTPSSNSSSTITVLPVLVPSSIAAAGTGDSASANVSSASGSPFVNAEHFSVPPPPFRHRSNVPLPRKKFKSDYTQRIRLKTNAKALGPVSIRQKNTSNNPTSKISQAPLYDPDPDSLLESCQETDESPFQPVDHPDYNGEDEQLHSFSKETNEQVKIEVLDGFQPEVVELEDDSSSEGQGAWDQSMGLDTVMANSSMETGGIGILLSDGGIGTELSRRAQGMSSTEVQSPTKYFDDSVQVRSRRSGVWQHFTSVTPSPEDGDSELYSQCNYCYKKYKRSTSTTNMKSHLNLSHQIYF